MRPIPPERLMVETDCSFLIPRDLKPKPKKHRNEPKYLPHILNRISYEWILIVRYLQLRLLKTLKNFLIFNIKLIL